MTAESHTLCNDRIAASIAARGAELVSLKNADGLELLWQAGPQWPRHAPLLFPIVGRLKNDELRHHGRTYPMPQHGFARDQKFEWIDLQSNRCALVLTESPATLARYPFPFRLTVAFTLHSTDLEVALGITNTGAGVLPASIGAHPAFNWPLLTGTAKEAYALNFSDDELAPIRRVKDGLLEAVAETTPIHGKNLELSDRLFDADAVILDHLASTSVRYAAGHGPSIKMSWEGFRELGIWSKPGAPFLCIEPWYGTASPSDFEGEFSEKPGLMQIAPAESRMVKYRIRVG